MSFKNFDLTFNKVWNIYFILAIKLLPKEIYLSRILKVLTKKNQQLDGQNISNLQYSILSHNYFTSVLVNYNRHARLSLSAHQNRKTKALTKNWTNAPKSNYHCTQLMKFSTSFIFQFSIFCTVECNAMRSWYISIFVTLCS